MKTKIQKALIIVALATTAAVFLLPLSFKFWWWNYNMFNKAGEIVEKL